VSPFCSATIYYIPLFPIVFEHEAILLRASYADAAFRGIALVVHPMQRVHVSAIDTVREIVESRWTLLAVQLCPFHCAQKKNPAYQPQVIAADFHTIEKMLLSFVNRNTKYTRLLPHVNTFR
jgi:hypothetical protein